MNSIDVLIANTLNATREARGKHIYALQRFAKEHEGTNALDPLEHELFKFCDFIIDDDDNVNGCAI